MHLTTTQSDLSVVEYLRYALDKLRDLIVDFLYVRGLVAYSGRVLLGKP